MKLTQITRPTDIRIDTSVGTRIFAGNTMIYGDTGSRNVLPLWAGSSKPVNARIRRLGNQVLMSIHTWIPESTTVLQPIEIPIGFRPSSPVNFPGTIGGSAGGRLLISGTAMTVYGLTVNSSTFFTMAWETNDSWPTTLPGLPA